MNILTKELDVGKLAPRGAKKKIGWLEERIPGGDERALTESMAAKIEHLKGMLKLAKKKYISERAWVVDIQEFTNWEINLLTIKLQAAKKKVKFLED